MTSVCVFTASSPGGRPEYLGAATELKGGGDVIGVIPAALVAKEVAHTGLTDLRVVESMHERHRKPCGLLNVHGYFDGLLAFLAHTIDEGFVRPQHAGMIAVATTPVDLLARLEAAPVPTVEKWLDRSSL
jgi:predicted Rossmann-fold nucleotide-binding protein